MPKTTRDGRPKQSELPSTLQKSPPKAQRTFTKVHDAAAEQYGEGARAHRTAFAALKHSFERVGDHWEQKAEKGDSDPPAGPRGSRRGRPTHEGVDTTASKAHLYELAKRLDVPGRSRMTKDELVEALQRANRRESARAR